MGLGVDAAAPGQVAAHGNNDQHDAAHDLRMGPRRLCTMMSRALTAMCASLVVLQVMAFGALHIVRCLVE